MAKGKSQIKRPSMRMPSGFILICFLILVFSSSLSFVKATEEMIETLGTSQSEHRQLVTTGGDVSTSVVSDKKDATTTQSGNSATTSSQSGDKNQIVIKSKYQIDPFDILKGAGDFRYKTKEDLLKTWTFVNQSNYDLTLK